mgnify:CR=1 FL=1
MDEAFEKNGPYPAGEKIEKEESRQLSSFLILINKVAINQIITKKKQGVKR